MMPGPVGAMPGDYAHKSSERRAARNAAGAAELETLERGETVVPDASEFLTSDLARAVWHTIRADEAGRLWSSGDHALALMLSVFIDGQFRPTADGKPRVVGPDSMRVIIQGMNELMLSASSKRRLGVVLQNDGDGADSEWLEQFRMEDE